MINSRPSHPLWFSGGLNTAAGKIFCECQSEKKQEIRLEVIEQKDSERNKPAVILPTPPSHSKPVFPCAKLSKYSAFQIQARRDTPEARERRYAPASREKHYANDRTRVRWTRVADRNIC